MTPLSDDQVKARFPDLVKQEKYIKRGTPILFMIMLTFGYYIDAVIGSLALSILLVLPYTLLRTQIAETVQMASMLLYHFPEEPASLQPLVGVRLALVQTETTRFLITYKEAVKEAPPPIDITCHPDLRGRMLVIHEGAHHLETIVDRKMMQEVIKRGAQRPDVDIPAIVPFALLAMAVGTILVYLLVIQIFQFFALDLALFSKVLSWIAPATVLLTQIPIWLERRKTIKRLTALHDAVFLQMSTKAAVIC